MMCKIVFSSCTEVFLIFLVLLLLNLWAFWKHNDSAIHVGILDSQARPKFLGLILGLVAFLCY